MSNINANDPTRLLLKIRNRLGLLPLYPHLPEEYKMEAWMEVIRLDTLPVWSRFFPNRIKYVVNQNTATYKDGWWYLREDILQNCVVLGITDLDWTSLANEDGTISSMALFGYPDIYSYASGYGTSSALTDQMMGYTLNADINSMFSNGSALYIETDEGNPMRFKVSGYSGHNYNLKNFTVNVLLEHKSLTTISPTKMNTFEDLATADIASFLYRNLKYYDGLETVFANIDLKLNDLESEANKRDGIIDKLENSYVTYSNTVQPLIVVQ